MSLLRHRRAEADLPDRLVQLVVAMSAISILAACGGGESSGTDATMADATAGRASAPAPAPAAGPSPADSAPAPVSAPETAAPPVSPAPAPAVASASTVATRPAAVPSVPVLAPVPASSRPAAPAPAATPPAPAPATGAAPMPTPGPASPPPAATTPRPAPTPAPAVAPLPAPAPAATAPTAPAPPAPSPVAPPPAAPAPAAPCNGKTIHVTRGADNGFFADGGSLGAGPGDTLLVRASPGAWSYVSLNNFHGTAACPITVRNEGGQVQMTAGFAVQNSSHVRVTGTGSPDAYGFRIDSGDKTGAGVSIFGRSRSVEVDHVQVLNKMYGFWIKEEASCDPALQYPNWVLDDMKIHHNHIDGMGQSGMYLGSTDPNGGRSITCNGVATSPWPLRLGNFQIHNNRVENTNRTGIQLSGAEFGANAIHDNIIRRTGLELNNQQGSGIALGGYTRADVLNNTIEDSYNAGILVLGAGPVTVRGNTITNSGKVAGQTAPGMAGIMVDVRPTTPFTRLHLTVRNNAIGAITDAGVRVYRSFDGYAANNLICHNSGTQSIDPNVNWTAVCP